MNDAQQLICEFAADFIEKNWDKILYDLDDSNLPTTKRRFINLVKSDPFVAQWVITELASWGMEEQNMLDYLYVDLTNFGYNYDFFDFIVLKIKDRYVKLKHVFKPKFDVIISFTQPKSKTIYYFE